MSDIAKMSLLYERKPTFIVSIFNAQNSFYLTLKNEKDSISSVENVLANLSMKLDDEEFYLGVYHIDGPLFAGEEVTQDISKSIKDILIAKNLMGFHLEQMPGSGEYGESEWIECRFDSIKKGEVEFDLKLNITYEIDVKNLKKEPFCTERIFNVNLSVPDDPSMDDRYDDNYETKIRMKAGEWIQTPDILVDNPAKSKSK